MRSSGSSQSNKFIIGSETAVEDIIGALARRGCLDLTPSINLPACSTLPLAGGGFSDLYQGVLLDSTKVAIKSLRVFNRPGRDNDKQKILKRAAKELYHWSKLNHRNVLPLLGLAMFRGHMSMISGWMENGSLLSYVGLNPKVNRINLCMDVCAGLCYIHTNNMVHGDLKAANVMVSPNGTALIADFGSSQLKDLTLVFTNTTNPSLSVRWAAPELLLEDDNPHVSKEADVYAFGMTALEALTGKIPYDGTSEKRVVILVAVEHKLPSRPAIGISDGLWDILTHCWTSNPSERPGVNTVQTQLQTLSPLLSQETASLDGPVTTSAREVCLGSNTIRATQLQQLDASTVTTKQLKLNSPGVPSIEASHVDEDPTDLLPLLQSEPEHKFDANQYAHKAHDYQNRLASADTGLGTSRACAQPLLVSLAQKLESTLSQVPALASTSSPSLLSIHRPVDGPARPKWNPMASIIPRRSLLQWPEWLLASRPNSPNMNNTNPLRNSTPNKHRPGSIIQGNRSGLGECERLGYSADMLNGPLAETPPGGLWKLMVYMNQDGISEEIFQRAYENTQKYTPLVPQTDEDEDAQREVKRVLGLFANEAGTWKSQLFLFAMEELVHLSLATLGVGGKMYLIHPFVQQRARAAVASRSACIKQTSFLLALSINVQRRPGDHGFSRLIAPHINEILDLFPTPNPNDAWQFAAVYRAVGCIDKAEPLEILVMGSRTRLLGPEHPDTLESMRYVAMTHADRGRLKEAERIHALVLAYQKRDLGKTHPDTLWSMENLATTYCQQGRLSAAETLQANTLAAQKQVLGEDHPDTLQSTASLVAIRYEQGRIAEAGVLGVKVLAARKRVLGDGHPDTLKSAESLAVIYSEQDRLADAETLEVNVLATRKQVLGVDHPHTLWCMANLAALYSKQRRLSEAWELQVKVLDVQRRVLGDIHPDTLQSQAGLAATHHALGQLHRAEALLVQVLATQGRLLGERHPNTLQSKASLAATYYEQGRILEAESLQAEVLAAQKRLLGEDHLDTVSTMSNLAATYQKQGRFAEVEPLMLKCLSIRKRRLGEGHPDTLQALHKLAWTYKAQRRQTEYNALALIPKATAVKTKRQ